MVVEANKNYEREEIFSEKVKAGKRTYFFDVKSTRSNDYYITITESKKRYNRDEDGVSFEKHKIFLYKEDFNKFVDALSQTVNHIKKELLPDFDYESGGQMGSNHTAESKSDDSKSDLKWD